MGAIGYMCVFGYAMAFVTYQFGAWFAGAGSILGTVLAVCVVGFTVYMLVRPNKYSENTLTVKVK